ncbi:MAG: hypothetical protein K940chlam9_00006 [Chlamydiae bacterium]|nr:hypothetical protein [Chlamydiota bacterium]
MRMLKNLALSLLLLTSAGYAQTCYDECNPCCGGNFEVSAEWLYFMSAIDQPYYAILNKVDDLPRADDFDGPRIANDQGWHSGYRLEAAYYLPNCFDHLRVRWTHFNNFSDSDHFASDDYWSILTHPDLGGVSGKIGIGIIKDEFEFYTLEILFGRSVYYCQGLNLTLEGGLQYSKVDLKESVFYSFPSNREYFIKNHSEMRGVGPELAFSFDYNINRCFSVVGRATGAYLISKKETKAFHNQFISESLLDVQNARDEDYYIGMPTLDARAGLAFDWSFDGCGCGCIDLSFEVGYEFMHVHKGVNRIYFVDDFAEGQSFNEYMDFTLHGPYIRVGVGF